MVSLSSCQQEKSEPFQLYSDPCRRASELRCGSSAVYPLLFVIGRKKSSLVTLSESEVALSKFEPSQGAKIERFILNPIVTSH